MTPFVQVYFLAVFQSLRKRHLLLVLRLRFKLEWSLSLAGILWRSNNIDAFIVIIIAFGGAIQGLVFILLKTSFCLRYFFFLVRIVVLSIKVVVSMLGIWLADSTHGGFFIISSIAILWFVVSSYRPWFFVSLITMEQSYDLENFFSLNVVHLLQGLQMIRDVWKPGDRHRNFWENLKSLWWVCNILQSGLMSNLNGRAEHSHCRWDQGGQGRRYGNATWCSALHLILPEVLNQVNQLIKFLSPGLYSLLQHQTGLKRFFKLFFKDLYFFLGQIMGVLKTGQFRCWKFLTFFVFQKCDVACCYCVSQKRKLFLNDFAYLLYVLFLLTTVPFSSQFLDGNLVFLLQYQRVLSCNMVDLSYCYFLQLIDLVCLLGELFGELNFALIDIIDTFKVVIGKHAELLELIAEMLVVSAHQVKNTVLSHCNFVKSIHQRV